MTEETRQGQPSDSVAEGSSISSFERPYGPLDGRSHGEGVRDANAWLAAVVESSDDAIVSKTLDGVITSWNGAATRLFGFTIAEAIGQPILILIPDDRQHEEAMILARIRCGERVEHFETVRRRKDGSLVDISLTVSPVRDDHGSIIGASKIARDISERKRLADRQSLLLREMNHRVKNLFAVTSALITLSERTAHGVAGLAEDLRGRMAALARAHDLTMPDLSGAVDGERTTTLFALLEAILAPHDNGTKTRTNVQGCDVSIRGPVLTSVALVLNEFSTNATKYGCLSIETGTLLIKSAVEGENLVLIWAETGRGAEVRIPPAGSGFGSQLERAAIEGTLHGSLTRVWAPSGLTITMRVPLSRLSGEV